MQHGDTFQLPYAGEDNHVTYVVINPPEETITHIVRARPMGLNSSLLGAEKLFFLPQLLKDLEDDKRTSEV